jgi:hypothetical protein
MGAGHGVTHSGAQPRIGLLSRLRMHQILLNEQCWKPNLIDLQRADVSEDQIRDASNLSVSVDARRKMLQY